MLNARWHGNHPTIPKQKTCIAPGFVILFGPNQPGEGYGLQSLLFQPFITGTSTSKRGLLAAAKTPTPIISEQKVRTIFSNIDTLTQLNGKFLADMRKRLGDWSDDSGACDCFGIVDLTPTDASFYNTL